MWDLNAWVVLLERLRFEFRCRSRVLMQVILNILLFFIEESVFLLTISMMPNLLFGPMEIWCPVFLGQIVNVVVRMMLGLFWDDMFSHLVFIINYVMVLALDWDHVV